MIKIVVFDLDDTLFPEYQYVYSGFIAVDNWIKSIYGDINFYNLATKIFEEGKRGNIFNLVLEHLELPDEKNDLINRLISIYREHKPKIQLHDDARWSINYFKDNKKLAIITDGYLISQKNKVHSLCIEDSFDLIVCTDEYGRENWKPSALPYQKIMRSFVCDGAECVYIGDNPRKDFITPKKLGWQTIQIIRPSGEYRNVSVDSAHEADSKIESLYELEKLIK